LVTGDWLPIISNQFKREYQMRFIKNLWLRVLLLYLGSLTIGTPSASCQTVASGFLDEAVDKVLQSNNLSQPFLPYECYTPYLIEIRENWDLLSPAQRERLSPFFLRPDNPESPYYREGGLPIVYDTRHFRCHYTVTGPYSVPLEDISPADGVPDYVQIAADAYEKAYYVVVEQMSYNCPPDDRWLADNGGDEKWDIYFFTGPWGGFTMPEYMVDLQSSTCATFSVYFAANTRYFQWLGEFKGSQAMQCTSAHEFFHAVQMSYNAYMYRWLMEACAMWIETRVFRAEKPDEPDGEEFCLRPMISWFLHPEKSLELLNGKHEYGDVIFMLYLSQKYGDQIIREIYQAMVPRVYSYLMNFREVFARRGSSLPSEFKEFTLWNALTGDRYDLKIREPSGELSERFHYSHGARYPSVAILQDNIHSQYPVKLVLDSRRSPDHLGARYIRFLPQEPGQENQLSIKIDGDDVGWEELGLLHGFGFCGWGAKILEIDWDDSTAVAEEIVPFPISQEGQINIDGFGNPIDEVILVLSNLDPEHDGGTVSYAADLSPQIKISELSATSDGNGFVRLRWAAEPSARVAGVRVMRKNAVLGPLQPEELYRPEVDDNRGDAYLFYGAFPLADLASDRTSFTDSTALLGPLTDESIYYYGVVPFTEEGILGTPGVTSGFIAPVDSIPPTGRLAVRKASSSALAIELVASEYLPLNRPPVLSCTLPDGTGREIQLESSGKGSFPYGSRLWRGTLAVPARMPSGEIAMQCLLIDKGGNSGLVSHTCPWEAGSLLTVFVYPNPFHSDDGAVAFDIDVQRGEQAKVRIFTPAGELVRSLQGEGVLRWDGRNQHGKRVAEGIYLYCVETAVGNALGKIVVID